MCNFNKIMDMQVKCPVCRSWLCLNCAATKHLPKNKTIWKDKEESIGSNDPIRYCYRCHIYFRSNKFYSTTNWNSNEACMGIVFILCTFVLLVIALVLHKRGQ